MGEFIRRWHPLIFLAIGLYLAIPKPAPNPAEIDNEFLEQYDTNEDGVIDREEFEGGDAAFEERDLNDDGALTTGSMLRWPLHEYKWNLGQDLKGGSSLRYVLRQQDLVDAANSIDQLIEPLQGNESRLSGEALEKFGDVIREGSGVLQPDMWEEGDFELLITPGLFDEGRADALQRYWKTWNDATKRRDAEDLVGPTIETLNRRLNTTGITELNIAPLGDNRLEVKLPEFSTRAETQRYKDLLETTGKLEMRVLASEDSDFVNLDVGELTRDEGYKYRWLEVEGDVSSQLVKENDEGKRFVPVQVIDDYSISGKDLTNIQPTTDRQGGIAVSFDLKGLAVARFETLSTRHKEAAAGGEDPRLLAIIIDDKVFSAYTIKDTISGSVQLSGRFSAQERDDIINVLKSGSLNVKLEMEGEETVGPSEGAESVRRGLLSLVFGAIAVFIIALIVYRGLGLLTIFNLVMVIVLLMGAMAAGLGTLTMPGIAGIVLTIGMAIDANILINERIREERERNQNTRGAIEEGFKNALSAIVDANVTTLLTALILFKVGSGPIQGFALTLAIGIVATLYTSLAAYKSMVMGILNVKRDVNMSMAGLKFVRDRNINWLRWMGPGALVALILIVSGGSFIFTHGAEIFGIEFRGGHTFRVQLKEPLERDDVAIKIVDENTGEPKFEWAEDVEVQPVFRLGGETTGGAADRYDFRFPMRADWANRDPEEITEELRARLTEVYAEELVEEGWEATRVEPTRATFRAEVTVALQDPEQFRQRYPDSYQDAWLARDRAWRTPNAPMEKKDQWFGAIAPENLQSLMAPNAAGDRQIYTVTASGVAVSGEDDLQTKLQAFKGAIERYYYGESEFVELVNEDDVKFEADATSAKLRVVVVTLDPINVSDFTEHVRQAPISASLEITPVDSEGDEARKFEITSMSPMAFSADPESSDHFTQVESTLNKHINDYVTQQTTEGNEISTRFLLSSAIGPTVANESKWRALFAIIAALVVVVIYIRIRFASVAWGLAAVAALLHDSFVVIGLIGLADYMGADIKIDLTVVAAILTVIGYSLNDTIINFDRIRENLKRDRLATGGKTPLKQIINESINQMLPRTFMTSGTTLMTTLAMLFLGGPLLKGFAFAMTMGIIVGTFSSIYIAGPILLFFDRRGQGSLLDMTEEEREEVEAEKQLLKQAGETVDDKPGEESTDEADNGDKPGKEDSGDDQDKKEAKKEEKKDDGKKD